MGLSNRTAKVLPRFRRQTLHVPNQMHTLRINYINYIYPRGPRVPSTWHAQKDFILNKMAEKEENSCSSCLQRTKYTCLRCREYFCMRCSVFEEDETVAGWKVGSTGRTANHAFEKRWKEK